MKRLLLACLLGLPLLVRAEIYDDMYQAIERDDVDGVTQILQQGFDPDSCNADGDSLLMTAIRNGDDAVASLLVSRSNMQHANRFRETPLMLAAYFGKDSLVTAMLARGASLNGAGNWSPLSYAAFNGHVTIAQVLLRYGAAVETPSENGTTALMVAAMNGHQEMVRLLLQYGADPVRVNQAGQNAISFALQKGNTDIAEELKARVEGRLAK